MTVNENVLWMHYSAAWYSCITFLAYAALNAQLTVLATSHVPAAASTLC